ncbi:hypothetical protein BKA70DRAFT_1406052 [Coprinopsis sp. MPI-PUGE-AT-0042]|nr:hypothetical protein BKA70DRAFT_1406052 [Coprinopsis sp. MPI-PUGE-AT-0042]
MAPDLPPSDASIEPIILKQTKTAQPFQVPGRTAHSWPLQIRESYGSLLTRRKTRYPQHQQYNAAERIVDIRLDGMERIMDVDPDRALSKDAVGHSGVARLGFLPSGPANDDASIVRGIDVPSNSPPHWPNDWSPYRFYSSSEESLSSDRTLSEARKKRPSSSDKTQYLIKLHRPGGNMHHIIMPTSCTVAELNKELNKRLLDPTQRVEPHRLYHAEGGMERLAAEERPIVIVGRRLRLEGYEPQYGIEQIGKEDVPFIYKFVYKSQFLGPPEEDLNFESFEVVDLTGRNLQIIPIILHRNAHCRLHLIAQALAKSSARHPTRRYPVMFFAGGSPAVKHGHVKGPAELPIFHKPLPPGPIVQSHQRPDRSIPNNKLTTLPWHVARLRTLVTLNISNNRFDELPKVVFDIKSLATLDVSFNKIKALPDELGKLVYFEKLLLVGNEIKRFPNTSSRLVHLDFLDYRRNLVNDLTIMSMLPMIRTSNADHNNVHALELSVGPANWPLPIFTHFSRPLLLPLDDIALGTLTSLKILRLYHNAFRTIPDSLGKLRWLRTLSCSDNNLDRLPTSIGQLQKLRTLDAHNNNLLELPSTIWNCVSLRRLNATSNRLGGWHDPSTIHDSIEDDDFLEGSASSATSIGSLPPLVHSLEKLYLGENILTHESVLTLMVFKEPRVLNLSFNEIQQLPPNFFCKMVYLEEMYPSRNKLVSIPTEDLHWMTRLMTLYLDGNKLLTLPQELGKLEELSILDVGSKSSKYNINNWKFNKRLKYLNLSGNNRFQIKAESARHSSSPNRISRDLVALGHQTLSGFKELGSLRVLGLMDVTITTTAQPPTFQNRQSSGNGIRNR